MAWSLPRPVDVVCGWEGVRQMKSGLLLHCCVVALLPCGGRNEQAGTGRAVRCVSGRITSRFRLQVAARRLAWAWLALLGCWGCFWPQTLAGAGQERAARAARAARALQAVTDRWAISSCARGRGAGGRCAPCCGSLQPAGGGGGGQDARG